MVSRQKGQAVQKHPSGARGSASPAFDAVIFDLDGVVTDTASVHASAWKELFDRYLRLRESRDGEPFHPFDHNSDYPAYVDGKPRYEGSRSFLESRGIQIPYGDPSDSPDQETVCGLGNGKDGLFASLLKRDGVGVFESTLGLIKGLKARGIKVGVASSSRNCLPVLQAAGIEELFETRVDGVLSATLGLKGKPDPDIFLKSAELLGVPVERIVVVEDAISGVQAGRNGHFGLVLGIERHGYSAVLKENGADLVVGDLAEISLGGIDDWFRRQAQALPSALERQKEIEERLSGKQVVVFLDYDGTLTPIVSRPELAVISEEMRDIVRRLADCCPTAIVSGREQEKVHQFVQVDTLFYAGSHGFEISGPGISTIQNEEGKRLLPTVDAAFQRLTEQLSEVPGALVEHVKFSISVHYRLVAEELVSTIEEVVDSVLIEYPPLRKTHGKKVFEVRPRIDWDKSKAVLWILNALALEGPNVVPLYLGDDTTDEDVFRVLKEKGIGILVAEAPRPSEAIYSLGDPAEVGQFLRQLISFLRQAQA